jgi:uncharacterized protein YggE
MIRISFVAIVIGAVVLCSAASSTADCGPRPETRTLEVSGQGEVKATPDMAELGVAIETSGPTAATAASENADLTQKVVVALKSKLGEKGKATTSGYALFAQYNDKPGQDKPRVTGYRADNSIKVETSALELLGPVIDAAIAAGANRIDSLSFKLRDDSTARNAAIGKAAKDAGLQAQALATSLGVHLKRIVHALTGSEPRPLPIQYGMAATRMMAAAPTPIEPNDVSISASVSVTYEIE